MTLSVHAASATLLSRTLNNLAACLDKAQAHADAKGFDSANYLTQRLAPDMLPLSSQIKIAGDIARMTLARLAGTELPAWPEGEPVTLAALTVRVRQAAAYVDSFSVADLQGSATKEIQVPQRGRDPLVFTGETFLQRWAIPNVFFHATTAYALLRQAGVNLGKADFLG
jgi:hypothetical protein